MYLAHFQELAQKHAIDIVPGTWTVEENGLLYNQARCINANGTTAGTYRKINLWETEKTPPHARYVRFGLPARFGRAR